MKGRKPLNNIAMTSAERKKRSREIAKQKATENTDMSQNCHEIEKNKIRNHKSWKTNEFLADVLAAIYNDCGDETIEECRRRIDNSVFLAYDKHRTGLW